MKHPAYVKRRHGTVKRTGENSWSVIIDGRRYSVQLDPSSDVFPLDRWRIVNSRGQVAAWDSRVAYDVRHAVRLALAND